MINSQVYLIAALLYCLFALQGCTQGTSSSWSESGNKSLAKVQGIWERTGYGDVFVIEEDGVKLYQYTRESCVLADALNPNSFNNLFVDIKVQDHGLAFMATSSSVPAFRLYFSRLDALPMTCNGDSLLTAAAPTQIFEHLWHTFNDYYAFFDKRGVNWDVQYRRFRQQIDDNMSETALFKRMSKMLSAIPDFHVNLESESEEFGAGELQGVDAILSEGFHNQTEWDDFDDYQADRLALYEQILFSYLDEDSIQHAGGTDDSLISWGRIENRVGYLTIPAMVSIASHAHYVSDDIDAIQAIMDQALTDLRDTDAMIIDVRFNNGGNDAVSLAIANYFTATRRLAITKGPWSYLGEMGRREAYLVPVGDKFYSKPVAVITGPNTISAGEIFVLAMRALPQTIQVGEPTIGMLSDELEKFLPNHWRFTLSNEVYYDYKGVNYEVEGIPPHVKAPAFSLDDLEAGRNSALETALKVLLP